MPEENRTTSWMFLSESDIPSSVQEMLVTGETAIASYKTVRDNAVFTTKRLIFQDVQGVTGSKVEVYSLPYSSINMWSIENAGTADIDSEVEFWTKAGKIRIKLQRGIDIRKLDKIIADAVL